MKSLILTSAKTFQCRFLILLLLLGLGTAALAQDALDTAAQRPKVEQPKKSTAPVSPTASAEPTAKASQKASMVKVTDVYRCGHILREDKLRNHAGIGDMIMLTVQGLPTLLAAARTSAGFDSVKGEKPYLRLFIDGRVIEGLEPEAIAVDSLAGTVQFHLVRNESNDETWADLLGSPGLGKNFWVRNSSLSLGLAGAHTTSTGGATLFIKRVDKPWFILSMAGLVIYLIALFVLARRSNILRAGAVNAAAIGVVNTPAGQTTYSLGRFQMAFWFSLVLASYLFIWLVTGNYDTITAGILGLIGISAGTSISGLMIDKSKEEDIINKTLPLITEQTQLAQTIANIQSQLVTVPPPVNAAALQAELATAVARQQQVNLAISLNQQAIKAPVSRGFMLDVLSDSNGVSFHRMQMFVWTLVLGLLFVYAVWARLAMPVFSATLLALQGLTAGTYLGFKIPEKQG